MIRILVLALALVLAPAASATEAGWALLREGGHVVLLRNAYVQGTAEPANFDIANCRTQRNLTERGRQQARKIGSLFAARAAATEQVLASRLCRTLDTARIAFGDRMVEPSELLDPPPADADAAAAQLAALRELISGYTDSGNLVLVADLALITALTGQNAREGEALIVRPQAEALHVVGRIIFN